MHTKTLAFVVGALLGVAVGEVSPQASEIAIASIALAVLQGAVMVIGKWRGAKSVAPFFIILFTLGIFLGVTRSQLMEEKMAYTCEVSCTFEARVVSSPQTKNEYQVFKVRLPGNDGTFLDVQVRAPLYPKYAIGETIRISGKVVEPSVIFPHGENKRSFDYASYLETRNVGSEMMYPKIEVIDGEAHDVTSVLGRWKEQMVLHIDLYVSSPASSIASGMLFGASSMSKELTRTFRAVGLSHIVVLSGFNIAIVIAFILFVFAFLPLVVRIILASVSVLLFVTMVGGEASVVRATLMAFIALLATLVGRAYVARQALIISLFAIVMYEPYALLHDVSLHLSFLATAGIVYMSSPLESVLDTHASGISKSFRELLITTVAAYLATLPYIIYSFGTISVYALLANLLVLPFVPVAMLLSFLVVVSSYVAGPLALMFGWLDSVLIDIVLFLAHTFERLPLATYPFTISFFGMCAAYVGLGILLLYLHQKRNETRPTIIDGVLTDVISY